MERYETKAEHEVKVAFASRAPIFLSFSPLYPQPSFRSSLVECTFTTSHFDCNPTGRTLRYGETCHPSSLPNFTQSYIFAAEEYVESFIAQ